jgi:plasmid stabilization system protein ParE
VKYRVVMTHKAEQDAENALQWFDHQSATAAGTRWFARLMAQIATLEKYPQRCALAPEAAEIGLEIRELGFGRRLGRYRLLFEIEGRSVVILRIWHGARDAISRDDL